MSSYLCDTCLNKGAMDDGALITCSHFEVTTKKIECGLYERDEDEFSARLDEHGEWFARRLVELEAENEKLRRMMRIRPHDFMKTLDENEDLRDELRGLKMIVGALNEYVKDANRENAELCELVRDIISDRNEIIDAYQGAKETVIWEYYSNIEEECAELREECERKRTEFDKRIAELGIDAE